MFIHPKVGCSTPDIARRALLIEVLEGMSRTPPLFLAARVVAEEVPKALVTCEVRPLHPMPIFFDRGVKYTHTLWRVAQLFYTDPTTAHG